MAGGCFEAVRRDMGWPVIVGCLGMATLAGVGR